MKAIYKKIVAIKKEIGTLKKNTENPFFKSQYLDLNALLDAIEPIFEKHNILLIQPIVDNKIQSIFIDIDSNENVVSEIELPNLTDPQKIGSAITYYRRYSIVSMFSLKVEDDDANKASGNSKTEKKPKQDNTPEPTKWLNVMDKEQNFTKEWLSIQKGITDGKLTSVQDVRKYYKVNKEVAAKLEEQFKN